MSPYYRRTEPGRGENLRAGLVAGGVAAAVAAVSFYFVRLFISREPMEALKSGGAEDGTSPTTRTGS